MDVAGAGRLPRLPRSGFVTRVRGLKHHCFSGARNLVIKIEIGPFTRVYLYKGITIGVIYRVEDYMS